MNYLEDLKIDGFPTIRLYTNNGTYINYEHHASVENFKTFLKENGVQW